MKKQNRPTQKSYDNYVEASKDAFVFSHLLELIEHMTEEIYELRNALEGDMVAEEVESSGYTQLYALGANKKTYMN